MSSDSRRDRVDPVRVEARVRRSIDDAFDLFTRDVGAWWPLDRASFGGDRALEVHFEPYVGGRFYERYTDGEEHTGGRVLRWDPPNVSPSPGSTTNGPLRPRSTCDSSSKPHLSRESNSNTEPGIGSAIAPHKCARCTTTAGRPSSAASSHWREPPKSTSGRSRG
jgi:hypothetical protein